ncbi:MAG: hypothetical protein EBZ59_10950 [Planctomycetia bacterium]|nr:hypothetical protein [Planctomycetia bacterium]
MAADHPDVVARLLPLVERMNAELAGPAPRGRRPAGEVKNPQTLYPTVAPAPRQQKPQQQRKQKASDGSAINRRPAVPASSRPEAPPPS